LFGFGRHSSRVAQASRAGGESVRPGGCTAILEMLLAQQSLARYHTRSGSVLMEEIGDVPEKLLYREPDAGCYPGVQSSILGAESCLTTSGCAHPANLHATWSAWQNRATDKTKRRAPLAPAGC
jgi:hypothetical protein